jgi:tetratricopeptide (TPR) repeat protein
MIDFGPPGGGHDPCSLTSTTMNPSDIRLDSLGFPIPPTFGASPAAAEAAPPRRYRTFTIRALLVLVAAGAAIMALVRADVGEPLTRSVAEWLANHAEQKHDVGDSEGALRDLDRAVAWSDKSPAIYLLRGQILLEKGDLRGSLADFNRLVNLAPKVYQTYLLRARVLQRLERHEDAIRDASQAVRLRPSAEMLNERAYTRAIAGLELEKALEDIKQALAEEQDNLNFLDTRGYIYLRRGQYAQALDDLDKAVEMTRKNPPFAGFPFAGNDPRRRRAIARDYQHGLAVMLHHRGEVHEKLGHAELAEKDLLEGDALGYNPAKGVY